MQPPKVIIVEDEPIIAADLSRQLEKEGIQVLDTIDEGNELIAHLKHEVPDLIIMDIQIYGDLDGIDLANHVSAQYNIPIIFLTSNTDDTTFNRAKLSFPHAFLSKPFRIRDVLHAIELALENKENGNDNDLEILDDRIFIRHKDSLEKVLFSSILYIKAEGAYTKIVTGEKEYILSQTLKKIEQKVATKYLLKIHRSFVVNIHNVDRISDGYVYVRKDKIPVSRSHRDELMQLFKTI